MKIRVVTVTMVEAPDDATHYSGELLDHPRWWVQKTNSTGVITAWYFWNEKQNCWHYQSEHKPHWLNEISKEETTL